MTDRKSVNKEEVYDAKIEAFLMYKHILCTPFLTPNAIPIHQSEPFNINAEFARLSSNWNELEILDKNQNVLEKSMLIEYVDIIMLLTLLLLLLVKISLITNLDIPVNNNINRESSSSVSSANGSPLLVRTTSSGSISHSPSLSGSTGSVGGSKAEKLLGLEGGGGSKAEKLLGLDGGSAPGSPSPNSKAHMLLGLDSPPPSSPNSKAHMLLGLEEQSSPNSTPKKSLLSSTGIANSPKFGLLARSASNNLLRDKVLDRENSKEDKSNGRSDSILGGSIGMSPNMSPISSPLSMSSGYSSSPSGSGLGSSPLLGSSPNGGMGSELHYSYTFTIQTKDVNYSFNARERDHSHAIVDGIKLLSSGRPFHPDSQITLDSLVEALDISQKCKTPNVPSLPSSPPPPPPHLLMNSGRKSVLIN